MNCRKFNKALPDWIAGRLPATRITEMAEHCAGCSRCSIEAEAERELRAAFQAIPAPSRSYDVTPILSSRLAERAPRWVWLPRRWALAGTLAAGVLCALVWIHPFTSGGVGGQMPLAGDDEKRIVTVVASMREAANPDSEYVIDTASHVPSQQRAVLVGGVED